MSDWGHVHRFITHNWKEDPHRTLLRPFGAVRSSPVPLMFDRANEGQPFKNDFVFTRLPMELTWQIMRLVPEADLANLALVNTDCRQLARSRQFASISLDYSQQASDLLRTICQERKERFCNDGRATRPTLGACIRKVTIMTRPCSVHARHTSIPWRGPDMSQNDRQHFEEAHNLFFDRYLSQIASILSDRNTLPHLESLDWHDTHPIDQPTMNAIMKSRAKDVIIRRLSFSQNLALDLSPPEHQTDIRSLYMDLRLASRYRDEIKREVRIPTSEILQHVAPTIESLVWMVQLSDDCQRLHDKHSGTRPFFPRLRDLSIQFWDELDPRWLDLLICPGQRSPIRSLEINTNKFPPSIEEFFETCGTIPYLETLVLSGHGPDMLNLTFLRSNSQIRKLGLFQFVDAWLLESTILPLLSRSFRNLTSLRIQWESSSLSQRALDSISKLDTLNQLYLGVTNQWESTWLVDHTVLRASLQSLTKLRKLVLYWDTYPLNPEFEYPATSQPTSTAFEEYYQLGRPRRYYEWRKRAYNSTVANEHVTEKWETQHRQHMIHIVEQYASEISSLEWMYVGQLPMGIERQSNGKKRIVVLSEGRTECEWLFCKMFGREKHLVPCGEVDECLEWLM